jgi:hypothetical protein|tara:strand:- start:166 stop:453 length:288 start_codon:yes stop_codon:yes gene_type:complete
MESLKNLRDKIQTLEKIHQLHILKILIENNISYTENSNGVFINMITLSEDVSNSIEKYLEYVSLQEDHLDKVETEKNKYLDEMEKDNKETVAVLS